MTKHRHPSSRRKQEEKKEAEDLFVEKMVELSSWAKKNSQALIIATVAVILVVATVMYIGNVRANRIQQAVAQLEQVQQAVVYGDREQAKASLVQYLATFDGTPYALEARLILGQVYLEDGDHSFKPRVRSGRTEPQNREEATSRYRRTGARSNTRAQSTRPLPGRRSPGRPAKGAARAPKSQNGSSPTRLSGQGNRSSGLR